MTIRDMLDAGVELQGNVSIRVWDEDLYDYETDVLIVASYGGLYEHDELLDREIKYMYPTTDYMDEIEVPVVVIELESESEEED